MTGTSMPSRGLNAGLARTPPARLEHSKNLAGTHAMTDPNTFGIAGLLGWPVAHSRSPVIHNHWLAQHTIPGRYVLFPVPPEKLESAVGGIAALGLRGCNVTTPHKQAIFPLLDRVDDLARRIGAVNTVVVEKDGTLTGFNNDGNGFIQSLRDADPKWRPDSGPILVLGAGGAARAVVASLAAQGAREIRVANRTLDKAQEIADAVGAVVKVLPWEAREDALDGIALLANATSLGMTGKPTLDMPLDRLPKSALVGDLIYIPPETPLLAAARVRGNITVNGLGLLLNQARPAFNAWFGVMPEITPALKKAIAATF
jgi:shikimate dehydrogenase